MWTQVESKYKNSKVRLMPNGQIYKVADLKRQGIADLIGGIPFDSIAEAEYYLYLDNLRRMGEVLEIQRQVRYVLQESFDKDGIHFPAITYIADFVVLYMGRIEVIDVKGMRTKEFELKRKMFENRYRELKLKMVKKSGNRWIDLEELAKAEKELKKRVKKK